MCFFPVPIDYAWQYLSWFKYVSGKNKTKKIPKAPSYFLWKPNFQSFYFFLFKIPIWDRTNIPWDGLVYLCCSLSLQTGATDVHSNSSASLGAWLLCACEYQPYGHMPSLPGLFKRTSIHFIYTTQIIYLKDKGALGWVHCISPCSGTDGFSVPLFVSCSLGKHSPINVLKERNIKKCTN